MEVLRLSNIGSGIISGIVEELAAADIPWTRHYGEYQSGGWLTCAVLGRTPDARNATVTDIRTPLETDLLRRCPRIAGLLAQLGFEFMVVRLASMAPGAMLWEHRDYEDLVPAARARLHVPVVADERAFLVSSGNRYTLVPGAMYMLKPVFPHGACNLGQRARIHLIMDVYEDDRLLGLAHNALPHSSERLPTLDSATLAAALGGLTDALPVSAPVGRSEQDVLALFFEYNTPEGFLYDAIIERYAQLGNCDRARFWTERRDLCLGVGVAH